MDIFYALVVMGIVLMAFAFWGFWWAVKNGQFDDLEGPAHRILMDDDDPLVPKSKSSPPAGNHKLEDD